MNSDSIRQAFLDYFKKQGHEHVASSPLVPEGDQTLMFANAGMNQFKELFTGQSKRNYTRATTSQKCVRAGGKHNDLENVGVTARHHTFFEMLGNFSFGDYFKRDAIAFAWEFLTENLKLDREKLWITIHDSDDEAGELWKEHTGLPDERIVKMGDKDNFWAMGETGPCGPCSEIHFDQGPGVGCQQADCALECDCDRYLEIWNLVFMQYEQKADGSRIPLPNPCIDTGMGLERLSAVVAGQTSNYDTDLFMPLLKKVAELTGKDYHQDERGLSHRVLADHSKAATFLIADGIFPTNEGRGYVLRRIMRRAIRHAYLLGSREPIMHELMNTVLEMYGKTYPDLIEKKDKIHKWIFEEEKGFLKKIEQGIRMFDQHKAEWKKTGQVPGAEAFKLYDTYGFPLDLTGVMAEQEGLAIDQTGFDASMKEQQDRARQASMFKTSQIEGLHWDVYDQGEQEFIGYDHLEAESKLLRSAKTESGQVLLAFKTTCFYGESGGQVGDSGEIIWQGNSFAVDDTQIVEGLRVCILSKDSSVMEVSADDSFVQKVDAQARRQTQINHTTTHILHKVLKETIGDHAEQRGSWVGPSHLRFDFAHPESISKDTLKTIEGKVNEHIAMNTDLNVSHMPIDEAKAKGVTALFGEKYGDIVRVVDIDACSQELCGGTHLDRTGDAQAFILRSESSIASGIRRIEGVTGEKALAELFAGRETLKGLSNRMQAQPQELESRVEIALQENQQLKKDLAELRQQMVMGQLNEKLANPSVLGEIKYLAEVLPDLEAAELRKAADNIHQRFPEMPLLMASEKEGKASLVLAYPKSWVKEKGKNAGKELKPLAKHIQGGGGGSPEIAQAGGRNPDGFSLVIQDFKKILQSID